MKTKELIQQLQKLDPELPVYIHSYEAGHVSPISARPENVEFHPDFKFSDNKLIVTIR